MTQKDTTAQVIQIILDVLAWLKVVYSARPCGRDVLPPQGAAGLSGQMVYAGGKLVPAKAGLLTKLPAALDMGWCCDRRRDHAQDDGTTGQDPSSAQPPHTSSAAEVEASAALASFDSCCPLGWMLQFLCCMPNVVPASVPENANDRRLTAAETVKRQFLRAAVATHERLRHRLCLSSALVRLSLLNSVLTFVLGVYGLTATISAAESFSTASTVQACQLAVTAIRLLAAWLPDLLRPGDFCDTHCCRHCWTTFGSECCVSRRGQRRVSSATAEAADQADHPAPGGEASDQAQEDASRYPFAYENPLHSATARSASGSGERKGRR